MSKIKFVRRELLPLLLQRRFMTVAYRSETLQSFSNCKAEISFLLVQQNGKIHCNYNTNHHLTPVLSFQRVKCNPREITRNKYRVSLLTQCSPMNYGWATAETGISNKNVCVCVNMRHDRNFNLNFVRHSSLAMMGESCTDYDGGSGSDDDCNTSWHAWQRSRYDFNILLARRENDTYRTWRRIYI